VEFEISVKQFSYISLYNKENHKFKDSVFFHLHEMNTKLIHFCCIKNNGDNILHFLF